MNTNLHQFVLDHLAARRIKWTQVSREAGVPYETLKKIASGRTPNPGVLHVQTLANYFQAKASAAPVNHAQAATETAAQGLN
jgi:predicted transcriptional regulator